MTRRGKWRLVKALLWLGALVYAAYWMLCAMGEAANPGGRSDGWYS